MKVLLEKAIGLKGADMTRSWTASIVNANRDVVVVASAITADAALREIEARLNEALQAVKEMRPEKGR